MVQRLKSSRFIYGSPSRRTVPRIQGIQCKNHLSTQDIDSKGSTDRMSGHLRTVKEPEPYKVELILISLFFGKKYDIYTLLM